MLILSASQISTYRDECKRKWGLKSIAKIPTPTHPSAELGTEVDNEQLQPYLRDGRTFDYTRESESGYIAASALAFLPEPKSNGLEVQKHFTFRSLANRDELSYQGYKDLWMPVGGVPLPEGFVSDIPAVVDFKTTGNVNSKWVKGPKVLETDVQAMVYATNAMVSTSSRVVDLVWIYMQTRGARKARRTHIRVDGKHVLEQFREIDRIGLEMLKVRREVESSGKPLEEACLDLPLPDSSDACDAFGGCPFRSRCNLSPDAFTSRLPQLEPIDMSDTATLLAQLKAKRAAKPGGPYPENIPSQFREAPAPVDVVGINPPESLLPPPAPAPIAPPTVAAEEASKRKPGRPKREKDPLGADVAMYSPPAPVAETVAPATETSKDSKEQRIGELVVELIALLRGAA